VLTLEVRGECWFTFTIREDRLGGLTIGSKIALRTAAGDRDLNSFLPRADPIGSTPKLEPGMTVWINRGKPLQAAEFGDAARAYIGSS
jgi:hypothetical protein